MAILGILYKVQKGKPFVMVMLFVHLFVTSITA